MTIRERSLEAEKCEGVLDLIDAWVQNRASAEETAHALYLVLPVAVSDAMKDIAVRGPVPLDPPAPAPEVIVERDAKPDNVDVVEAELEENEAVVAEAVEDESVWDPSAYEIHILDQGFEHFPNSGWHLSFEAIGCPRLSYQTRDPVLNAYLPFKSIDPSRQLSAGGGSGSALERVTGFASKAAALMLGTDQESTILRGALGAAVVDTDKQADYRVPMQMPDDAQIVEACRKSIARHLILVRQERARLAVTEAASRDIVGKRFR